MLFSMQRRNIFLTRTTLRPQFLVTSYRTAAASKAAGAKEVEAEFESMFVIIACWHQVAAIQH